MSQPQTMPDSEASSFDKVSFYFAPHPDDWQLFMNPFAFEDVSDDRTKAVFVHVTAGDAGLGLGSAGRAHPYFLARENGAECAIRFMADADGLPTKSEVSSIQCSGHAIRRLRHKNTRSYFLRLPDGNPGGTGYPATGHQSLARLARGEITTYAAIDGSTVYRGWTDLVATLRAIMELEGGDAEKSILHVPERDPLINPGDHSDHLATAEAAIAAAGALHNTCRYHHVGYPSSSRPENLTGQQRDMKSAVYAVTLAGIQALDHTIAWHHYDRAFVGRNYFRIEE